MRQRHNVHLSTEEHHEIAHWTRVSVFIHGGLFAIALLAVVAAGAVAPATNDATVQTTAAQPLRFMGSAALSAASTVRLLPEYHAREDLSDAMAALGYDALPEDPYMYHVFGGGSGDTAQPEPPNEQMTALTR